jgi:hypothetical protein
VTQRGGGPIARSPGTYEPAHESLSLNAFYSNDASRHEGTSRGHSRPDDVVASTG